MWLGFRVLCWCSTLYFNGGQYSVNNIALVDIVDCQCMFDTANNFLALKVIYMQLFRPINFIHETKDRWVYCAAFGMLVNLFSVVHSSFWCEYRTRE